MVRKQDVVLFAQSRLSLALHRSADLKHCAAATTFRSSSRATSLLSRMPGSLPTVLASLILFPNTSWWMALDDFEVIAMSVCCPGGIRAVEMI